MRSGEAGYPRSTGGAGSQWPSGQDNCVSSWVNVGRVAPAALALLAPPKPP